MNKTIFSLFLSVLLSLPLTCDANNVVQSKTTKNALLKFNRIIITGNCPFGIILANQEAYERVIGVGPWVFLHAKMKLLKDMKPDITRITYDFINTDYIVNIESLLNLNPDIIYYYGVTQNNNLERTGIPLINLDADKNIKDNPIKTQAYWEDTFNQTLGLPSSHKFIDAWGNTLSEIKSYTDIIRKQNIRALYIQQSDGKQLKVSGAKTFGDTYLKMVGMENVADSILIKGDSGRYINVSMEQIIQWNPDIIFVVYGSAEDILNEKNPGQDWHEINAFKNKMIFSTPEGIHNWGGLSAETPLLPLFMISKFNSNYISNEKLEKLTRQYYKHMFHYTISDELLHDVLSQH